MAAKRTLLAPSIALLLLLSCALSYAFLPAWMSLPDTPTLPHPASSSFASVKGVKLWYAVYGKGTPVILLHGGLANSNYWGKLIPELVDHHFQVIVIDTRGHGRSSRDETPYSYPLLASDVLAVMDHLKIKKAAIVGWSDGAITGLYLAIHAPQRITQLFAYGANSNFREIKEDALLHPTLIRYSLRAEKEYKLLSATPENFETFDSAVSEMESTQPDFSKAELNSISIPVCIADGTHDEFVKPDNVHYMAENIPDAQLQWIEDTSHFSMLQSPKLFNDLVITFLTV